MILSDGHFTLKKNDILWEVTVFLYRINMFNGRWLVTVTSLLTKCINQENIVTQRGFLIVCSCIWYLRLGIWLAIDRLRRPLSINVYILIINTIYIFYVLVASLRLAEVYSDKIHPLS